MWHVDAEIISLIFMLVIFADVVKMNKHAALQDRLFRLLAECSVLAIVCDIVSSTAMMRYETVAWWTIQGSLLAYFLFMPLLPTLWQLYAMAVVGTEAHGLRWKMAATMLPYAAFAVVVLTNPITGFLFHLSSGNVYGRGPFFNSVFVVFYGYSMATLLLTLVHFKKLERTNRTVLLIFPVIAGLGVFLQQLWTGYLITGAAFTLVLLITYLFLQNRKATRDPLTGVFNRMAFCDVTDKLVQGSEQGLVLAVTVDDFKWFNQTFGQKNGDRLLKRIAEYLVQKTPGKACYRYGGDIFTIILKKADEQEGRRLAREIIDVLAQSFYMEHAGYCVSITVGIVAYPLQSAQGNHSMITALDFAIYQAKKRGKGQICFFNEEAIGQFRRKYEIMEAITRAIENHAFEVYIQPIYHTQQKKFIFAEALLRLHDDKLGWISPAEFVPIAEETGQIIAITYFVLGKVCAFIKKNRAILQDAVSISVNFSVIQFMQTDMVEKVKDIIESHHLPPELIKIEITESVIADSFDDIGAAMKQLNDFGIRFALDDYGQGYSNISYLINLPFSFVKLDKSVIDNITRDKAMIDALVPMFKKLDMILIPEGVETREQADILDGLCCDAIQGYFFARPMSMESALDVFRGCHT